VDEILSVGDAGFQIKCDARIQDFRRMEKTIIIVSHDLPLVARLCSRILLLDRGQVVADGVPGSILAQYDELVHQTTP